MPTRPKQQRRRHRALDNDAKLAHTTRLLSHTLITMENERGELVDRKPTRTPSLPKLESQIWTPLFGACPQFHDTRILTQ
jgi:hypothetical protein